MRSTSFLGGLSALMDLAAPPWNVRIAVRAYRPHFDDESLAKLAFVGSLLVPKKLSDGTYLAVDVWRGVDPMLGWTTTMLAPYNPSENVQHEPPEYVLGVADFGVHDSNVPARGAGDDGSVALPLNKGRVVRVHSPLGVTEKGFALGFILYAGAALVAGRQGYMGVSSPVKMDRAKLDAPGGDRTPDATAVWTKSILTLGFNGGKPLGQSAKLTYRYQGDGGSETVVWPTEYILTESVVKSGLVLRLIKGLDDKFGPRVKPPDVPLNTSLQFLSVGRKQL